MRRPALVLLAAVALAGCAASPGTPDDADDAAGGMLPVFLPPVPVSTSYPGAEPVIAVAPDGTIYVEGIGAGENGNVNKVSRSTDGGQTWTDITPPGPGTERSNDGFVAVSTDGTVYAANVFALTFQLYASEDRGDTWTLLPIPRVPALMHRHWIVAQADVVHVTIEALPPGFLPWLADGPTMAQAGSANEGMWYLRSEDGGATWTTPVQIDPIVNFAGQGNMVVSHDGNRIYVPRYEEPSRAVEDYTYAEGCWYILLSEDGGDSWERRSMFDLVGELSTAVPSLAIDADGALYFGWSSALASGPTRALLATSTDGARTWSAPREVSARDGTHAMVWLATRAPGEIGVMWFSANATQPATAVDADWFVDYALVTQATSDAPVVRETRVTPTSVHAGNICAKGPACGEGEDRTLLDYPWMAFHDGRAHLVYPSTAWDRPSAFAVVAIET